jgi:hypothetical protein
MNLLKEVAAEFVGMFLGDARLAAATVALIAATAALTEIAHSGRIVAGAVLLGGALLILVDSVRHAAKGR